MNKLDKKCSSDVLMSERQNKVASRAVYEKPILVCYGDVRDITLGATQGVVEIGSGCAQGTFTNGNPTDLCL